MRSRAQDVVQRLLRRHGISITRYPSPETLPWMLEHLLPTLAVTEVVDVGAHHGEFVRVIREEVGFRGQITSFEPFGESFAILQGCWGQDPMWAGHQVAIGAKSGQRRLNIFRESVFNSFLSPKSVATARWPGLSEPRHVEEVRVERLDSFPFNEGPLLLKTDTQGHDLDVLEGAAGILDRVGAIIIEVAARPIYEGAPSLVDIALRLDGLGFEPLGFVPVSRGADHLHVIEFDGVFVR